ncbi:PAS domain-containing protein [Roseibium salinum]|uniref:PAS domain-containing protein n=1 Tax=Roseibium salinum TaxID=1604349 RepID=A0ABT3R7Q1_9HYPH|nr:PAS domain-containing protein [Roseibium sp. DSM 29163]MCX2725283.1 PAS domain-containing protein [Roseibium sp. DSM 29163]
MADCITLDLERSFGELNDCVLVTDPERIVVFANKAMEKLLQVDRGELLGTTTKRFFANPAQFEKMAVLYHSPPIDGTASHMQSTSSAATERKPPWRSSARRCLTHRTI